MNWSPPLALDSGYALGTATAHQENMGPSASFQVLPAPHAVGGPTWVVHAQGRLIGGGNIAVQLAGTNLPSRH